MNRISKLLICILALVIAAAGVIPAAANAENDARQLIDSIVEFNLKESSASSVQEWINGDLTENAGQGSEWYVIALRQYGSYDFSQYEAALLKYLSENEVGSASSRLKYALTLTAVGSSDSCISETLGNSIGEQGIMSLIFGMHLLNNGCTSDKYSVSALKQEILSFQLADGGWAISGTNGDVDVTAMAVQALAPHYSADGSVKSAVDAAVDFLSARQNDNGDYSSYGVNNPESTAQVLTALSSLGIDAETDSRFIKNGNTVFSGIGLYRLSDGSFCHKEGGNSNSTATVQVFYSLVSYIRMKTDGGRLYVFDSEEPTQPPATSKENVTVTEASAETTAEIPQTTSDLTENEPSSADIAEATSASTKALTHAEAPKTEKNGSFKLWAVAAAAVIAAAACLVLLILKRRNPKDYIIIIILAAAAVIFVLIADFQLPENYYNSASTKENSVGTVTVTVRCDTVKGENAAHIPQNGIILDAAEFEIEEGDTVYDVLLEAAGRYKLHIETSGTKQSIYVEGINNIYELEFGDLSGWMYFVNGSSPSVGCGEYELLPGDEIEWHYTRNIGKDLSVE